jgi:hypothetical protein
MREGVAPMLNSGEPKRYKPLLMSLPRKGEIISLYRSLWREAGRIQFDYVR